MKNEDSQNGAKVISKEWEFGCGKNKWEPYDPTQNKNLSQAFSSGEKTFDVSTPRVESSVLFDRMVQRKNKTGWEVPVRCKLSDPTADEKCMLSSLSIYLFIGLFQKRSNPASKEKISVV